MLHTSTLTQTKTISDALQLRTRHFLNLILLHTSTLIPTKTCSDVLRLRTSSFFNRILLHISTRTQTKTFSDALRLQSPFSNRDLVASHLTAQKDTHPRQNKSRPRHTQVSYECGQAMFQIVTLLHTNTIIQAKTFLDARRPRTNHRSSK